MPVCHDCSTVIRVSLPYSTIDLEGMERPIAQHRNITVKSQLHPGDAVTALMNSALSHCVFIGGVLPTAPCATCLVRSEVFRPHCGLLAEFFK